MNNNVDEKAREALEKMFMDSFGSSDQDKDLLITVRKIFSGEDDIEIPKEFLADVEDGEEQGNLYSIINEMGIPQKIKLALFGNKLARAILIRDSNRQVSMVVLQNAGLGEGEILDFIRNPNLDDQIHRSIVRNSTWMKNYEMKAAVVANPKIPIDVALKFVKFLNNKDLKRYSKSKNIPQVIATQCKKISQKRES